MNSKVDFIHLSGFLISSLKFLVKMSFFLERNNENLVIEIEESRMCGKWKEETQKYSNLSFGSLKSL